MLFFRASYLKIPRETVPERTLSGTSLLRYFTVSLAALDTALPAAFVILHLYLYPFRDFFAVRE